MNWPEPIAVAVAFAVLFEVGFLCGRRELRVRVRRVESAWKSRHCRELHALHRAIDSLPTFGPTFERPASTSLVLQEKVLGFVEEFIDALEEPS